MYFERKVPFTTTSFNKGGWAIFDGGPAFEGSLFSRVSLFYDKSFSVLPFDTWCRQIICTVCYPESKTIPT